MENSSCISTHIISISLGSLIDNELYIQDFEEKNFEYMRRIIEHIIGEKALTVKHKNITTMFVLDCKDSTEALWNDLLAWYTAYGAYPEIYNFTGFDMREINCTKCMRKSTLIAKYKMYRNAIESKICDLNLDELKQSITFFRNLLDEMIGLCNCKSSEAEILGVSEFIDLLIVRYTSSKSDCNSRCG